MINVQDMLISQLERELIIIGGKIVEEITEEIQESEDPTVILHNDQFELAFNPKKNEVQFSTTYSNQDIDQNWIDELLILNQSKAKIEELLTLIIRGGK